MDRRQFIIWDRRDGEQPQPTYWKDRGGFRHEIQPKAQGKPRQDEEGLFVSDGILGKISRDNVYLTAYPDMDNARFPDGCESLDDLQVGQRVENVKYNLSGSSGVYDIYRIQDAPPERRLKYAREFRELTEVVTGRLTLAQALIDMTLNDPECVPLLKHDDENIETEVTMTEGGAVVKVYILE